MLSHNINPECGSNEPQYRQTYKAAGMKSFGKTDRVPKLPRKARDENRMTEAMVEGVNQRNPRMPEKPMEYKQTIVSPNLHKERYFKSEHGGTPPDTPEDSVIEEPKPKKKRPVSPKQPPQ